MGPFSAVLSTRPGEKEAHQVATLALAEGTDRAQALADGPVSYLI